MGIYDFNVKKTDGSMQSIGDFKGKVMLIANTATDCGFTPQYKDLGDLYTKYNDKGFEVLDFPCNQFGEQAPGSDDEICVFCATKYQTPYEIYSKVNVNGEGSDPLFEYLKSQKGFEGFNNPDHPLNDKLKAMFSKQNPDYDKTPDIKWNFTKFLVDRDGNVVKRFEPVDDIAIMEKEIAKYL